ncbi:hypothetical protein [Agrococcus sp. BE272]|uniref:hypothetical protein n=1 Tax=Agrococcus sp. BE272 TaxID=2817727 RepID=UPI00285F413B|nr:hypothetical protein [Agrococcus sp. BE272]MDR7233964.1 membrane associated rhomboid family serine protease [Agrococcus sp. BE272]
MRTRRIVAVVLGVLALPLLVLGLIDPLEGGLALLAAVALLALARVLSGEPVPRLLWIPIVVALALGVLLLAALALVPPPAEVDGSVGNPLGGGAAAGVWVYRAAVLVAIAGGVVYAVRIVRAARPSVARAAA